MAEVGDTSSSWEGRNTRIIVGFIILIQYNYDY